MDSNILISIIVPAYNIEAYIERCLNSILQQTYQNLEVIVVDDGSTDETGRIIDQFAERDCRIMPLHKENEGVSSARMMGIEVARGEYIGFVDGDDYIEAEMYQHLLNNAIKYRADISHCGYKMVFPDQHIVEYYATGRVEKQSNEEALVALLSGKYVEPGLGNKLYHKLIMQAFKAEDIWDSTIKINEDLLMNYLLFKNANTCIYEDKTFYHYILRKGSAATSRKHHHITDPMKVIRIIMGDLGSNNILYTLVYERYLRVLINVATQKDWKRDAADAKKTLKVECISGKLFNMCSSVKLKLMVVGVSFISPVYKLIRTIYDRVTGVSRKYNI